MDALDARILREMYRDRASSMRGLDPRTSAATIGDAVGISRTAVRDRVRAWERAGFLCGYDVWPNVELFGASLHGLNVRVDDPREKPKVLEAIGLVDGALAALDLVGPWVSTICAAESPAVMAQRARLVSRLPGVAEAEPFRIFHAPPCRVDVTPLDWRIVRALRDGPRRTLDETARAVGVSTRTVRRRYERLLDGDAVWFMPELDYTRMSGAHVRVNLWPASGASRRELERAFDAAFPDALPVVGPPGVEDHPVMANLHFPSTAAVEEARRTMQDLPGVGEVEVLFPVRSHHYATWLDARIAGALAGAPAR